MKLWFNIRFGVRHWQWGPHGMTFKVNQNQVEWRNKHLGSGSLCITGLESGCDE